MPSKRVSFPPSGAKSHRSHDSVRDSGLGSLSSEYASVGSRPDRKFTTQDYDQRHDPGAVQEALDRATEKVVHYKEKVQQLDNEVSKAHKARREAEALWKAQIDRNEQLEQELSIARKQYTELQASFDILQYNYDDLKQQYAIDTDPMDNPMMPADATFPIRTKSKHDHKYERDETRMKDRLKVRLSPKEEAGSKSSHRSSRDRSRAPSNRQNAYIEEVPSPRTHGSNYMTSSESHRQSMMPPSPYSSGPRTPQALYHAASEFPDGDYHAYPLPNETRGRR